MTTFLWVIVVLVSISLLGFLYRLVIGPTTPDRVIALGCHWGRINYIDRTHFHPI